MKTFQYTCLCVEGVDFHCSDVLDQLANDKLFVTTSMDRLMLNARWSAEDKLKGPIHGYPQAMHVEVQLRGQLPAAPSWRRCHHGGGPHR
jgi:hypothetical protein